MKNFLRRFLAGSLSAVCLLSPISPADPDIFASSEISDIEKTELDFSSGRLILAVPDESESELLSDEHLIASFGDLYLLQYASSEQAEAAYLYFQNQVPFVEPDSTLETAGFFQTADSFAPFTITEEINPLEALTSSVSPEILSRPAIALIDTGVSESDRVIDRISLIDDIPDGGGHGDICAAAIWKENPDAFILSLRAMNDDGIGTVSSVVAAIEYAIEQQVPIINLSLCARRTAANSVLAYEIRKASKLGITVVGAAGNDGAPASDYLPGYCREAYVIAACDASGTLLSSSNYGDTVDYGVTAESTSEASAIFSGYISRYGTESLPGAPYIFSLSTAQDTLSSETLFIDKEVYTSHSFERTLLTDTVTIYPGTSLDDLDELSGEICDYFISKDKDSIQLLYSDVDNQHEGLYHMVYRIFDETTGASLKLLRPILVTEAEHSETNFSRQVIGLMTDSSQADLNLLSKRLDYAPGESVEVTLTASDDTILCSLDAFSESVLTGDENLWSTEAPGLFLGDPLKLEEIPQDADTVKNQDLDTVLGINETTRHYRFVMPSHDVYLYAKTKSATFHTADGTTDALDRFEVYTPNAAGTVYYYHPSVSASGYPRGTRKREVTYTWLDEDNKIHTEKRVIYCIQPNMPSPTEGTTRYSSSKEQVIALTGNSLMAKGLYYLYGGPGWNREIELSDGTTINMKSLLDEYAPTAPGSIGADGYYSLTHFILGYLYTPSNETSWNYVSGSDNPVWNGTGKSWLSKIRTTLSRLPSPSVSIRQGTSDVTGSTIPLSSQFKVTDEGVYRTPLLKYVTFDQNRARGTLPSGVTMVYGGGVEHTGRFSLEGGQNFYLKFKFSELPENIRRSGQVTLTFKTSYPVNYEAWKILTPNIQDLGFSYFTGDRSIPLTVNLPLTILRIDKKAVTMNAKKVLSKSWTSSLSGTQFGLYNEKGTYLLAVTTLTDSYPNNSFKWTDSSGTPRRDANGNTIPFPAVMGMTYTVRELHTSSDYLSVPDFQIRIPQNSTYQPSYTEEVVNVPKIELQILKQSTFTELLTLQDYSLSGAVFDIYSDEACSQLVGTVTTGKDGRSELLSLPVHNYTKKSWTFYVKEISAPSGHTVNPEIKPVSVSLPSIPKKQTVTVTFTDEPQLMEFPAALIHKVDDENNQIKGAVFKVCLYDTGNVQSLTDRTLKKTWYLRSDAAGNVLLDTDHLADNRKNSYHSDPFYQYGQRNVLPVGCYLTIQEIETADPALYALDDTTYRFDTSLPISQAIRITNERTQAKHGVIRLKKYHSDGATPLLGVTFKLTLKQTIADPLGGTALDFEPLLTHEGDSAIQTTDSLGQVVFKNLLTGIYTITEVKTAQGYTLLKEPIQVVLPITYSKNKAAELGDSLNLSKAEQDADGNYYFYDLTYEITNHHVIAPPASGGMGIFIPIISGFLILFILFLFLRKTKLSLQ